MGAPWIPKHIGYKEQEKEKMIWCLLPRDWDLVTMGYLSHPLKSQCQTYSVIICRIKWDNRSGISQYEIRGGIGIASGSSFLSQISDFFTFHSAEKSFSKEAYTGQKRGKGSSFGMPVGFLHAPMPPSVTTSTAPSSGPRVTFAESLGWSEFCVGIAPLGCDLFLFLAGLLLRLRWMVMLCRKWGPAMSTCQNQAITNPQEPEAHCSQMAPTVCPQSWRKHPVLRRKATGEERTLKQALKLGGVNVRVVCNATKFLEFIDCSTSNSFLQAYICIWKCAMVFIHSVSFLMLN